MVDFALTVNLKDDPEVIKKYKAYHANPWPEVVNALQEVGVQDMKIYLLGRRLFMFCTANDGFDPEKDLPKYLELDDKCMEWEQIMDELQEPVPEARPGEKWARMEKIFQL